MYNKEKTLVILTPAFPANETEENWIPFQQMLLRSFKKLYPDVKVIVLSFIYPGNQTEYKWNDITVMPFDGNKYRKLKRPLLWRKIWKKLKEINREQKISTILSFWCGECALMGSYFGKMKSIKHFIWICGQDARKDNKLVKFIRPPANELIAMSDFLIDEFDRNHHVRPAQIIPGGVDQSMYDNKNSLKDIDIIGVGTLSFLKQYNIFVEVIGGLKKHKPQIKAILCGDGEAELDIKQMRKDLSLEDNLLFTGMVKPKEAIK